jgi:CheY-like chemotaxis protein
MPWRILVVDDNPLMRELIGCHLADLSATVIDFDAAEPAMAALLGNTFDLLITDLGMPGEHDGLWLLQRARHHLPELPIIVITGSPLEALDLRAADAVVLKPFHPDELLGEVLDLLGG